MRLRDFAANTTSQFGEDGIIDKIFDVAKVQSRLVFDCGASDGFELSNSHTLWAERGWRAILVEADPGRYLSLLETTTFAAPTVRALMHNLTVDGATSIDGLCGGEQPDLLSLDIDGDEFYILQAMQTRPRVIVAEFNATMPLRSRWVGEQGKPIGCSLGAMRNLLWTRGYQLAEITHCNGIFVDAAVALELRGAGFTLGLEENDEASTLRVEVSAYNGDYIVLGPKPFGRNDELDPSHVTELIS